MPDQIEKEALFLLIDKEFELASIYAIKGVSMFGRFKESFSDLNRKEKLQNLCHNRMELENHIKKIEEISSKLEGKI